MRTKLVRTDIKQCGAVLTLIEECFRASRIIKEKPGRERKESEEMRK